MKTLLSFTAHRASKLPVSQRPESLDLALSDGAFDDLRSLLQSGGFDARFPVPGSSDSLSLEIVEDSEIYHRVVRLIDTDTQKRPSEFVGVGCLYKRLQNVNQFVPEFIVQRRRVYTAEELDRAAFLLLLPEPKIGKLAAVQPDGCPVLQVQSGWRPELGFGGLFPSWLMCVSDLVGAGLQEASLNGLDLRPAAFDQSVVGREGGVEWLTSTITLPRSILRLCDSTGKPFIQGKSKGCHFVSPTEPVELIYNESDLGVGWDIAKTNEIIGASPRIATNLLVISQRFRTVLLRLGITEARYVPVQTTPPISGPTQTVAI